MKGNTRLARFVLLVSAVCLCLTADAADQAKASGSIPDRRADKQYLQTQIKHMTDRDLFAALDLDKPALAKIKVAVEAGDYTAAYRAWAAYWDANKTVDAVAHGHTLKPVAALHKELRAQPDRVAEARRDAEPVMRHQINGWGNVTRQHGPVVDFNFNYGKSGKYGFHYWSWSQPLLTAFHATGEETYLAKFDELFHQWYEQRDAVRGGFGHLDPVWYELGLGIRNLWFLHYYTCPYPDRPIETHRRMLKTALGSARWLYELQRQGYRDGNWQSTGCRGLVEIAVRLPEFRDSSSWLRLGIQRLAEHMERDFYEDGCHSERVPTDYMAICYDGPRRVMALLKAAGIQDKEAQSFGARLETVLQWWMLATNPLGGLPCLNDSAARSIPAHLLLEGAERYSRPDFLYVADRLMRGAAKPGGTPPKTTSVHLEPSGATVMRSGWSREDNYLFLNHGTRNLGHSHRAALDFELYGRGGALALDAGRGHSYDDPLHGPWYTAARAHNMLVVNEADVDKRTARGRDVFWHSDARLDVFAATHHGYQGSHGLIHRRSVAFLKPDVFVVFDSCTARLAGQTLSWYFHSPTDLQVGESGRVASARGPGVLLMEAWPGQIEKTREGRGMCALENENGERRHGEIAWIAYDKKTRAGHDNRFAVLMLPFAERAPEVTFNALPSPPGTALLQLIRNGVENLIVFGNGRRLELMNGRLAMDGSFAWMQKRRDGRYEACPTPGTTLTWDGRDVERTADEE
jgi:hypothetical protein